MASQYWHEFLPSFSGVVVVVSFILAIVAYISGVRSVKVRPRRVGNGNSTKYPDRPRFHSTKAAAVRENFSRGFMRKKELADSVICFCSKTRDAIWSLAAGVVFASVFAHEHWHGMVQWFINHLTSNEGAAWGDIMAYFVLIFLGAGVACCFWLIRDIGQWVRASRLTETYLYKLNKRPIIVEAPTLNYYYEVFKWAVKTSIEERQAKQAEAKRQELHRTKKPFNCQIIEFDRRAI